jgi:hypothetical protein
MRHLRKAAAICKNQKLLAALICAAKLGGSGFLHGLNRSEHDSITILAIGSARLWTPKKPAADRRATGAIARSGQSSQTLVQRTCA